MHSCYHLQRSWAKVIFSQACVILFTEGSASVHAGIPPSGPGTPLGAGTPQTRHPPGPGTPQTRHPQSRHPQTRHPPRPGTPLDQAPPDQAAPPPRCRACWEIRSTRGRYASYWNAILCCNISTLGLCYFFKRFGIKMFQNLTFCRYQ